MHQDTPGDVINVRQILDLLPHRYPFLLVDRVLEWEKGKRIKALKNVTFNEPFFQGHFPGQPLMPGVLILEAMAQAGGLLVSLSLPDMPAKLFVFSGMDKVRFRRPVHPGDQLILETMEVRQRMQLVKMHCLATVDGDLACEADLSAAIVDRAGI
ncbi:3-hydroxyacyl-ACP dehydratase FabZ [Megalodesulfovibrio paquesii]